MAILSLGTKKRVINSAAKHPVIIKDGVMNIVGFGVFLLANLFGTYRAVRAMEGAKHKHVIEAADVTIAAAPAGTIVNVQIDFDSFDWTMEFARPGDQYGAVKNFQIVTTAGETSATFIQKLYDAINAEILDGEFNLLTANLELGVLTLEGREIGLAFRVKFLGEDAGQSEVVTRYAPEITKSKDGVNTYAQLRTVVLQNEVTVAPHTLQGLQLPEEDAKYTSINFTQDQDRTGFVQDGASASGTVGARNTFQVYIKESEANQPTIDAILNFLGSKPGLQAELYDKNGAVVADLVAFKA